MCFLIQSKYQGYLQEKLGANPANPSSGNSNLNILNGEKSELSALGSKKNSLENQTKYIDLHVVKQNTKIQYNSKSAMSRKTSKDALHDSKKESNTETTPIGKSLTGFGDPNSRTRTASGKQLNSTKTETTQV